MRHSLKIMIAAAATLAFSAMAQAAPITIDGDDFNNNGSTSSQVIEGITWSTGATNRYFKLKTVDNVTGVGITGGRTNDEIDIGETLTGTSATPFAISSITLGVLFDGPEFGDYKEVAQITINGVLDIILTATGETEATLSGATGTVENLSPANKDKGGVWRIDFAPYLPPVTSVSFTALKANCEHCNQSDFTLVQLVAKPVPEPASLALLGLGLVGIGVARRRRS